MRFPQRCAPLLAIVLLACSDDPAPADRQTGRAGRAGASGSSGSSAGGSKGGAGGRAGAAGSSAGAVGASAGSAGASGSTITGGTSGAAGASGGSTAGTSGASGDAGANAGGANAGGKGGSFGNGGMNDGGSNAGGKGGAAGASGTSGSSGAGGTSGAGGSSGSSGSSGSGGSAGGSSGPQDFCGNYASVIRMTIPWGDFTRYKTGDYGGFGPDTIVVAAFTVPAVPSTYATTGYDAWAEWQGPPTQRILTLSESQCDFRTADPTGVKGPLDATGGLTPLLYFNVGSGAGASGLVPGRTYYFNLQNQNCLTATCNASTTVAWPH